MSHAFTPEPLTSESSPLGLLASPVSPLGRVFVSVSCVLCLWPPPGMATLWGWGEPLSLLPPGFRLLMAGLAPKCTLAVPKGRKYGDGSAAEFGLTPCHFCALTGTRISTRKLRSCSMMPSASGRAPWAGTTPLSVLLALLALCFLRLSLCCPQPTPRGSQERGVGTLFSYCPLIAVVLSSLRPNIFFLKKILMAK